MGLIWFVKFSDQVWFIKLIQNKNLEGKWLSLWRTNNGWLGMQQKEMRIDERW